MSINDDANIKSLFAQLQAYTSDETSKVEAEIARLTREMKNRHEAAAKDFYRIAALIRTASESTKLLSNESSTLTPPVTPEYNDKVITIDPKITPTKHTKAIQQSNITYAVDFDEDIFEIDGINFKDKNDLQQDNSEEESDLESVENRVYSRNRSGSVNIARSAPISMPVFNHHSIAIEMQEENKVNERHTDIASSIKMLARSIHNDSVFGDLPRQLYNNEF